LPRSGIGVGEAWRRLLDAEPPETGDGSWTGPLETILGRGPLARRMLAAAGEVPGRTELRRLSERLCDCLAANEPFRDEQRGRSLAS
jgi:hypothetical protein